MKVLTAIFTVLSIPLMVLNLLGGVVSGIWLAVIGQWAPLGWGIAAFIVSSSFLGLALAPTLLLMIPAARLAEKGKTFGFVVFGGLSGLYAIGLITVWCCGVLLLFVKDATQASLIPRLIWSFGVATGPWAYIASQDDGPQGEVSAATIATFFAQLAYLTLMLLVIFTDLTLMSALKVFLGFMLVALAIQITLAVLIQREMQTVSTEFEGTYIDADVEPDDQ